MPQRYGDFATWTGSLGTVAAFAVGFWQIRRERTERQRRETREWLAAKREHADRVSAWRTGEDIIVSNGSHHLIHSVRVALDGHEPVFLDHVEPGRTSVPLGTHGDTVPVTALTFTDARGDRWVREAGELPRRLTQEDSP